MGGFSLYSTRDDPARGAASILPCRCHDFPPDRLVTVSEPALPFRQFSLMSPFPARLCERPRQYMLSSLRGSRSKTLLSKPVINPGRQEPGSVTDADLDRHGRTDLLKQMLRRRHTSSRPQPHSRPPCDLTQRCQDSLEIARFATHCQLQIRATSYRANNASMLRSSSGASVIEKLIERWPLSR